MIPSRQPLRVLHVITSLNAGGAETTLTRLVEALDGRDFTSAVVSLMDQGALRAALRDAGIRTETLAMRSRLPGPAIAARLRDIAVEFRPDVVHGWMTQGNMAALGASSLGNGAPVVWGIRQSLYDMRYEPWLTRILIRAGALLSSRTASVVYNSATAARHHERIGYRADRTLVVPNGFDTKRFRPDPAAAASVRAELNIPPGTPIVLMLARAHPMKDHALLIRAVSRVIGEAGIAVEFVLAGAGVDQDSPIGQIVRNEGLAPVVHLLGARRDTERLAAAADIGVLSSYTESFPNALGEIMAAGAPCVTTDVGAAAQLVGDTGIVVPPRDTDALAAALTKLVSLDAVERRALGTRARERIEQHYSLMAMVGAYADLYRRVARAGA